jgi:hypothetical protein
VVEIKDGIPELPERKRYARREAAPQQEQPRGLPCELLYRPADIGSPLSAGSDADCDRPNEEMEKAADRKSRTRHDLKRTGIGHLFGGLRGLSQFPFNDVIP